MKISETDKLTLRGIKSLAESYESKLEDLHKLVREIVGEEDEMGYSSDFIYGARPLDEFIEIMEN